MRTKNHLIPHIVKFVKPGSRINTDEASNFKLLKERYGFDHEMVDHSRKEYVRGDVHTNTIEGFWSNVKRGIKGTYVHVSKKHLTSYLREFEYRHNLRRTPYLMFDCWPAPGFEDTEFGVLMEPEVRHGEAEVYTRVQA
jgi:transposase